MNKRILLITILSVCVLVTACGGSASSSSDSSGIEVSNTENEKTTMDVTVKEQVLVEQDGITVTLKGIDMNGFWGPEFQLEIKNDTERNIMISANDVSINGIMVDPMFATSVAAGKASNSSMDVFSSTLEKAGVETIQNVEMKFRVSDDDSYDELFVTDNIVVSTSADGSFVQEYNDEGTEIFSNDSFRIVAQKLDSEDSFWGADIYLYIENNSDKTVMVQSRDTSINGYMVDPSFSVDITPGKKAFSTLTFFESDLESNGIETIDEMETSFVIMDSDSWDQIIKTDPITINFN